jgi:L-alanine-DL-glutamate epimerase-like enolase superfamily enzyme
VQDDGLIDLPTRPGLGWAIDWSYIDKHAVARVRAGN